MNDLEHIREPQAIAAITAETVEMGFNMASEPLTGSLLRTLATSKKGGRFLELGSGTGLSTAWILDGMDGESTLLTVDNDAQVLSILKNHIGEDARLTVVCEDGDRFIESLAGQQFDFIFADTWSGKYQKLTEALDLVAPGGFYVIDDMLPQASWPEGHEAKVVELIATLESLDRFQVTKMAWASGLMVLTRVD